VARERREKGPKSREHAVIVWRPHRVGGAPSCSIARTQSWSLASRPLDGTKEVRMAGARTTIKVKISAWTLGSAWTTTRRHGST